MSVQRWTNGRCGVFHIPNGHRSNLGWHLHCTQNQHVSVPLNVLSVQTFSDGLMRLLANRLEFQVLVT